MKWIVMAALLAGCAPNSGVMELGSGRYRVTEEASWTQAGAESGIIRQANEYCAARGRRAEVNITSTRPHTAYAHYAGASAEFTCLAR